VLETQDLPYVFRGQSTVIPNVTGVFCGAVGELILDAAESARVSGLMLEFNRQVSAAVVGPHLYQKCSPGKPTRTS